MADKLMNIDNLKETIIKKVKEEIINLIPPEALNKFIEETIKQFKKEDLEGVIKETLKEHVKAEVKKMLNGAIYGQYIDESNMQALKPFMEDILVKAAPTMFANIMREIARNTIVSMQNNNMF